MSKTNPTAQSTSNRAERYARAAALLRRWLVEADEEDDRDYDWQAIDHELHDATMRCREPTDESEVE